MADSMLELVRKEAFRLRQELENTPAYKRLQAAERLLKAYEADTGTTSFPAKEEQPATTKAAPLKSRGGKTAQIIQHCEDYLRRTNMRATSGAFLPYLESVGVKLTGKKPSRTVASYLSHSKRFNSVPALGGYGLAEWGQLVPVQYGPHPDATPELPNLNPSGEAKH